MSPPGPPSSRHSGRAARLAERFAEELRLRGYSPRTRTAYGRHVEEFLAFAHGSATLDDAIRDFFVARTRDGGMSRSYHNQLLSAIRLFCRTVLGRPIEDLPLDRPRREHHLPTVLSREEVKRLLAAIRNRKHKAILTLCYSAGLRVSEVVHLRLADLDRERGLIHVRRGKGAKDRYTLLADAAWTTVDAYLEGETIGGWLFPGPHPTRPLSTRSVQKVVERARVAARIEKRFELSWDQWTVS